jgi:CRP-like cAMP-binding protein
MMIRHLRDDRLRRLPGFAGCSDRELARILTLADVIDVASDHVLVREGDQTREFYVILAGRASVTREGKLLDIIGPGDYCGELASLDPSPRNATVSMVSDGTVLAMGQREFDTLVTELPQLSRRLLSGLARPRAHPGRPHLTRA